MMSEHRLLSHHQQRFSLSQQLVVLAQSEQWETLLEWEARYLEKVEDPSASLPFYELSPAAQEALTHLQQKILRNEQQLRQLLQQRKEILITLIVHCTQQHVLNNTYGKING